MKRIILCLLLVGNFFWGQIVSATVPQSNPQQRGFLNRVQQTVSETFKTTLPEYYEKIAEAWQAISEQGFFGETFTSDKSGREVIVSLQSAVERAMIEEYADCSNMLMIIHTPTIPTPLVTEGEVSTDLVATPFLQDPDQSPVKTALSRAYLLRRYLAQGGVIVTVYQGDRRTGDRGRTPEQLAVFEALKQQYPTQIIEYPIDPDFLPNGEFPQDLIGATYWIEQSPDVYVEMSLKSSQINQPCDNCEWGFWFQTSESPNEATTTRLATVYDFLASVGYDPDEEELMD